MDQIINYFDDSEEVSYPNREAIDNFMYLSNVTRSDITFAVRVLSLFMGKPKYIHVNAMQRIMIMSYIKGTINYGSFYSAE